MGKGTKIKFLKNNCVGEVSVIDKYPVLYANSSKKKEHNLYSSGTGTIIGRNGVCLEGESGLRVKGTKKLSY